MGSEKTMGKEKKKRSKLKIFLIILLIVAVLAGGGFALYVYTTPQITLNGDAVMNVTMADGYTEPGAEASFAFHDISEYVKIDASDVNDQKVGIYKVVYTVDYLDKTAVKERTVNVIDREPPEITLNGDDPLVIRPGTKFDDPGVTAIDDSDGDVSYRVTAKGFVDVYNKGEYEVTYTVSDTYGNEATATRVVEVKGKPAHKVKGVIYLTFDDGPSNTVTPRILKTLEKYDVPATFFVIGYYSDPKKIKLMKRALKDGCTIGLHGTSHDYSQIYTSVPDFMNNIETLHEQLLLDLGYDAFAMRFPGGSSNTVSKEYCKGIMTKLVKKVQKEGYMYNDWNVDSTDASANSVAASTLIYNVKRYCRKNTYNVILMHDSDAKGTTADALPEIIRWGKKEGYKFKAMTIDSPTVHHPVNN